MVFWWTLVGIAIFLIGVAKSGFGGSIGMLVVPITAIALRNIPDRGAEATLGLLLPCLILGDLIAVYQYRRLFSWTTVRRLLPGTILGVVLGGFLLWWFRRFADVVGDLILLAIGVECVALVALHWWLVFRGAREELLHEPLRGHMAGLFAGGSSTVAHAAGPIITMYMLPLGFDRRLFVGTCVVYFFILNATKLPAYYLAGQFERVEVVFSLCMLPLVLFGSLFGFWINRRLSDRSFSRIVYVLTFLLGWYVLYKGILGLAGVSGE